MEKAAKSKSRIFSFIFLNQQPFSPGREKFRAGKGFSGPIISIIPAEARRKTRNGSFDAQQEPTSPKVSCIGQIKHKKKICKAKCATTPPPAKVVKDSSSNKKQGRKGKKKQGSSAIGKLFKKGKKQRPRDDEGEEEEANVEVIRAPGLGQMRKFSSGREAFRDFDYRAADRGGAAAALNRVRGYYSDEDPRDSDHSDDDDDDDYEDDFQVPYSGPLVAFSAPLAVGGGVGGRALEPRKEINIWKRRTMAPPPPLELISNSNKRL